MKIGAVFPQLEIGADPKVVRDWATTVEDAGYNHVLAYDHVLGADPANRPGWTGYTDKSLFHEVFVLFGYLAGITTELELVTGVLVLPQRQTALVAKQAAEVDVLSGGRLRLGVGIGWNHVEYQALGVPFRQRGALLEEQVDVLRRLWADPVISYDGKYHEIEEAGLNPLPGREIPIWFGGSADAVLRRTGRIGDGWMPSRRRTRRRATRSPASGKQPKRPAATPLRSVSRRASPWARSRSRTGAPSPTAGATSVRPTSASTR